MDLIAINYLHTSKSSGSNESSITMVAVSILTFTEWGSGRRRVREGGKEDEGGREGG